MTRAVIVVRIKGKRVLFNSRDVPADAVAHNVCPLVKIHRPERMNYKERADSREFERKKFRLLSNHSGHHATNLICDSKVRYEAVDFWTLLSFFESDTG